MKDTVSHYVPPHSPLTSTEPQVFSNNLTMPPGVPGGHTDGTHDPTRAVARTPGTAGQARSRQARPCTPHPLCPDPRGTRAPQAGVPPLLFPIR